MDLLYEHAHDEGDPIQGSGGVTNNPHWLTRAEKETRAPLDGHRTTVATSHRLPSMDRTLDPLEYLPPELSAFIITQALPPQDMNSLPSMYSSRLIELTTVSTKWQSFLFSMSLLWSELVIDKRQEDFLATLSIFVRLSSNTPVKLFLCGKPTGIDWTELASILLPDAERVTSLRFGLVRADDLEWVPNALSNLVKRLCRLPRLKEVTFDTIYPVRVSLLRIKSFGLPPAVKFTGLFAIELPESCWGSGTRSRFFNVTKCNPSGTLGQLVPPSQRDLLRFEYHTYFRKSNIISSGITLLQLESLADRLAECNCFEQVIHTATFILNRLEFEIDLSQTEDLLDCLRMLIHLQDLELRIRWGDRKITRDHALSDTTSRDLKTIDLELVGGVENLAVAHKLLGDLFSGLGTLYPAVEEVCLRGSAWIDLEASYIQSLRALKSLVLDFEDSPSALPSGPITLRSVQRLEIRGVVRLDKLRTHNLLELLLDLGSEVTKLDHLGPFPRGLRSLVLTLKDDMADFNLTSLDCPNLRNLYLASYVPRASWGRLWLPNLVSIQVGFPLKGFTDPSSNQLCITLLCYPRRLPSLRELHFVKCVEWDILFLMLRRRNHDECGVQRIDKVTLPFIPFAFHELLVRLLAGEIVELPSLISLSLEATREVMFDSSVPGCFACMKNMRPGCTQRLGSDENQTVIPADILYPPEDATPEELPWEVQDWLSQRRELVNIWKASYVEFTQEFSRSLLCMNWYPGVGVV